MRIPRNTTYIKALALVNNNAHDTGDEVTIKKDAEGWHLQNPHKPYQSFRASINAIRNENYYHIMEMR